MLNTPNAEPLTFETFHEFATVYCATFDRMMSYSLQQVGSRIYVEKLAALADAYPEWAAQVENGPQSDDPDGPWSGGFAENH